MVVEPIRAVLGLAGVLVGAELMVVNASSIATKFGVSQIVIGFTLVALGTSLPELVTTVAAQRRGESDLVVGNLFLIYFGIVAALKRRYFDLVLVGAT